ncbi:MAG: hypothetical protein DMG57_30440 [Acidobacteria bacterium]|nr:MAG: hypothetical protein DMG57_30440 [Acidobacteriota bacterium]
MHLFHRYTVVAVVVKGADVGFIMKNAVYHGPTPLAAAAIPGPFGCFPSIEQQNYGYQLFFNHERAQKWLTCVHSFVDSLASFLPST